MTKLIVEENGNRRGFQMRPGKVTIGSAQTCSLQLASADVAAEHAELELTESEAILRCRPGVQPAVQAGRPLGPEARLQNGVPFKLGSAVLTVELEGQPRARPVARPAPAQSARPGPRRGASGDGGGRRERYRPRSRSNPMTPVLILLVAGAVALVAWKGLDALVGGTAPDYDPEATYRRAESLVQQASFRTALDALDGIAATGKELSPELEQKIANLRAEIDAGLAAGREAVNNVFGTKWMEVKLKKYEEFWLTDKPERPEMRVFVKRLRYFKERWPTHPEMDWVERQERRFEPLVDLSRPPTYEDVEFEAQLLVGLRRHPISGRILASRTADWKAAFAEIDAFLLTAEGDDREAALELLDDLRARRDDWVADKLQQARHHWEQAEANDWDSGLLGKSIAWLVKIVQNSGDVDMANDAARRMIGYDAQADLAAFLRGYKRDQPDAFEALAANAVLGDYMRKKGILD